MAVLVVTLALAGGGYAAALDTSMFALQNLVLVGGSSAVDAQVRAALAPELGKSLLRVSGADVDREAAVLPDVVSLRFVRSFPHTLRVFVTPERPVLLIRRGKLGFVVSARGRIMAESRDPLTSSLPRMWVGRGTLLAVGQTLHRTNGLLGVVAAAALKPGEIPGVRFVTVTGDQITMLTASGFQLRLGENSALGLKLAIATRIIAVVGAQIGADSYLDVSVPQRPVLGSSNSQLASTG